MPTYGVTDTGFVSKTEEILLAELDVAVKANISPSADTTVNGPLGRLLAIIATMRAEDWEVAEGVYNSQYDQATGQSLDYVSGLTGTVRDAPAFSTVSADVNIDGGTVITAGQIIVSAVGNPNALFENVDPFTAPFTGAWPLDFIAQTSGPVLAPSGTLTVLEVTITGVNSVTNALDADPGDNQEQDPELRVKRREELTAQGTGTDDSLAGDVRKVDDVESVKVISNRSTQPSSSQPGCSFQVVVFGGVDNDIAQAVWDGMPSGVNDYGTTSGSATDDGGNVQSVAFSRPTEIRVYCDITLTVDADDYEGDAAVKTAIGSFTDGTLLIELPDGSILDGASEVGGDVYASVLYNALFTVAGIVDADIKVGTSPSPSGTSVAITDDEIVAVSSVKGIQTADVTVVS